MAGIHGVKRSVRLGRTDISEVIGTSELGRLFKKSRWWARSLLDRWLDEQNKGGEIRVITRQDSKDRLILETTRAVVACYLPAARDQALVHKVSLLEKDISFQAGRIDKLTELIRALERRLGPVNAGPRMPQERVSGVQPQGNLSRR